MANYSNLLATIAANIYTNNNNEVTAAGVQAAVNAMVASMGAGYQFMGVAHPSDTPSGYADLRAFWLAGEAGTYTNFGGLVLADGEVAVLKYNGSWSKEMTGAASAAALSDFKKDINLRVDGVSLVDKFYDWSNGYVAGQTILSSALSQFCQPILCRAGEKIVYRTGSSYGSAVVKVADDTPISVGSSGFVEAVLINAPVAGQTYEYVFTEDTWIVISVLISDYSVDVYAFTNDSVSSHIDALEDEVFADFTDRAALNTIFDELYVCGFVEGYHFSHFVWNGTSVTAIIRDSGNNIVWFANGLAASAGDVFEYSQGGVSVYAVFNATTHLTSPEDSAILGRALDLSKNGKISEYVLTPNVFFSPICVSRFNLGNVLPGADHNASWVSISRRCDEANDSVFNFANKTAPAVSNKFFDFYEVGTRARTGRFVGQLSNYLDYSGKNGLSTSDALLMPIIVGAVNNIDGDNTTEKWFTGGNHAYGNTSTGSPTLREVSNNIRVDGVDVPVGMGGVRGRVCTIDLVNRIQGYNTCKVDGGGREIIQENVHIEVTNTHIDVSVEFVALEEVILYGPMYASGMNVENMVGYRFVGSQSRRGLYVYNGGNTPSSDDDAINAIRIYTNGDYLFDTELDLSYGLGNKEMVGSGYPNCIVTTSKKAYLTIIPSGKQIHLNIGDGVSYKTRLYFRKK